MFISAHLPTVSYQDPWDVSLEHRLSLLRGKDSRIVYYYENPDNSTFRYRVFNMVESLNANPELGISASWFAKPDFERMDRFIDRADALVLCRARFDPRVDRILRRARVRKIPVLFDVDDLVFDSEYLSLILDSLDQDSGSERNWNNWFAYTGRMAATMRRCDGVITTNQYLADKIAEFAPGLVPRIIPNFLNRAQQEPSCAMWEAKRASNFERNDQIHIGYFSGSPTHNRDFEIAASALAKMMDEDSRVVLRVVGLLSTAGPLTRHQDRIELFPLQDFVNLQRLIGEVEINIAPLQNNVFTNCKSELKYFEAAIVGTLTIASPTFNFRNSIVDGENGFLSAAHEWGPKFRQALDAIADAKRYAGLVECAHQRALDAYGWNRTAGRIAAAVFGENGGAPETASAADAAAGD